tara:strand:+ start:6833 stop:7873 length:1041 start_codon:yes stop_codon:yes gene_type:complete
MTYDLLKQYNAFNQNNANVIPPRKATRNELIKFHTKDYIDAIENMSNNPNTISAALYNLGTADNPCYPQMFEVALLSTGGSALAADLLISSEYDSVFNISGGLHHAMRSNASGFCVFNDPVIAIEKFLEQKMKIAYIDIDCHHGDGVQEAFYDRDDVLTISIHESGAFLFPGTGNTNEIGTGKGRGYSINVPLYPYTYDELYKDTFKKIVPPLIEFFQPDVLVTQMGIDSHFQDPITHLSLTVQGFTEILKIFKSFNLKWLSLGGGGYNLKAVARAWASGWGVISNQTLQNDIPINFNQTHNISSLFDISPPKITDDIKNVCKKFVDKNISTLEKDLKAIYSINFD